MLIAGERRLRAARQAGLTDVPCIVRDASDQEILEWSLIENIQRSDLNPIERAGAYRAYMDRFALTQADLAKRTGESRANVANYLRLLDLCDDVQAMLLDGSLSFGHARALAGLAGRAAEQLALARRIAAEGLPVRQTERLVAAAQEGSAGADDGPSAPARPKAPFLCDLEGQLTRAVGTRVTILPGRARNTGRIVVEYYSLDDFDRIAAGLGLKAEG
jgi:ParB family chromosome partitioning protein